MCVEICVDLRIDMCTDMESIIDLTYLLLLRRHTLGFGSLSHSFHGCPLIRDLSFRLELVSRALSRLYLGIADGMPIARV